MTLPLSILVLHLNPNLDWWEQPDMSTFKMTPLARPWIRGNSNKHSLVYSWWIPIAWTTHKFIEYKRHDITGVLETSKKNIWELYRLSVFHQAVRPKSGHASLLSPRTNYKLPEAASELQAKVPPVSIQKQRFFFKLNCTV